MAMGITRWEHQGGRLLGLLLALSLTLMGCSPSLKQAQTSIQESETKCAGKHFINHYDRSRCVTTHALETLDQQGFRHMDVILWWQEHELDFADAQDEGRLGPENVEKLRQLLRAKVNDMLSNRDRASTRAALQAMGRGLQEAGQSMQQSSPPPQPDRQGNLVTACGAKGMVPDFVTGNCVSSSGRQVNPANLYPPFHSPMPEPSPGELIMRCEGRAVDFVTGRCM